MPSAAGDDESSAILRWPAWSIFVIPTVFVVAIGLSWRFQPVFFEWDGIFQVVAGREIFAGLGYHGWPSHFWPPLYSVLAGLAGKALPIYPGARLVSLVAAGGLLVVTYHLARLWFDDPAVALGAQFFTSLNPLVVREALAAQNHMLEAFCFLACVTLLLRGLSEPRSSTFALAGVVGGLAGLTRYTSYILFPIGAAAILLALRRDRRASLVGAATFLAGAGIVSLPWWTYNALQNGSPLANWHYLNTGMSMMKYVDPQSTEARWLFRDQESFSSVSQLVRTYPRAFFTNMWHTAGDVLVLCFQLAKGLQLLVPFGIAYAIVRHDQRTRRATLLVMSIFVAWTLLVSQAYTKTYAMTVWAVVFTILAVAFLGAVGRWLTARRRNPILSYAYAGVGALLAVLALRGARDAVLSYGGPNHDAYGQLRDWASIRDAMRAHDPAFAEKTVMSSHPGWGWNLGTHGYIEMPHYYIGTARQLGVLEGLGPRVRRYTPRWPSETPDSALRADYILYDSVARSQVPQVESQLEAEASSPDHGVTVVYRGPYATLYELHWHRLDSASVTAGR